MKSGLILPSNSPKPFSPAESGLLPVAVPGWTIKQLEP